MKQLLAVFAGLALALTGAQAQSTNQVPNFLQTALTWGTSFNTNADHSWTNTVLEVGVGYEQVTGAGATSVADIQYDLGRWNVGADIQYFGVGSAINVVEAQGGFSLIQKYDLKVDADLRVGYDFNSQDAIIEPGLFLKKKMTYNTYAEVGASLPFELKSTFSRNPTFYVETGFTF